MEKLLQKIEDLKKNLDSFLPLNIEFKRKLDKKFRLEFNFNSNHIEGNTLTYGETELLLYFDDTTGNHKHREYEEMKAHDLAIELIKDWANDNERPLSELKIKELNKIILVKPFYKEAITEDGQNTRKLIQIGNYKNLPNHVKLSNGEIFEYASVSDTPILMGELIQWYQNEEHKKELHPVVLAAFLHYKFVRIHPFDDGNGRISRLLMNYVLYKNNFPPVIIKSKDKNNYLSALNKADVGDLDSFVKYILEQSIWSLELSIKAAKGESIDEKDDLDKEIEVWKKQNVLSKTQSVKRDGQVIYNLFTNCIHTLFLNFENKHKQFFDLFLEVNVKFYRDNNPKSLYELLNNGFDNGIEMIFSNTNFHSYVNENEEEIYVEFFEEIKMIISLGEFKFNPEKPFSTNSSIEISFKPYQYIVNFANNQKIEKKYNEYLSQEEQNLIIEESKKYIFEVIKKHSI